MQKTNKKSLGIEKEIKKKGKKLYVKLKSYDYMSNWKAMIILLTVGLI